MRNWIATLTTAASVLMLGCSTLSPAAGPPLTSKLAIGQGLGGSWDDVGTAHPVAVARLEYRPDGGPADFWMEQEDGSDWNADGGAAQQNPRLDRVLEVILFGQPSNAGTESFATRRRTRASRQRL